MPEITVIVPVYNVEPYLNRCIDSIIHQTFSDFELILVDDGDSGECGEICDAYALRDERVSVIHRINGGLSVARNTGIDLTFLDNDSEWIAFVDSDDWVHPEYLEYLYRAVKKTNTALSVCKYSEQTEYTLISAVDASTDILSWDEFLIHNHVCGVVAWNKLYAKKLFEGLRYPVGKIHEDEFLTYKILNRAEKVAFLGTQLYYYYQNPTGIMGATFSLSRFDASEAFLEAIEFAHALGNKPIQRLYVNCFLFNGWRNLQAMRTTEGIQDNVKREKEAELKRQFRKILIRFGLRYAPPWHEAQYYDFAFPVLNNIARYSVRLGRKAINITKYFKS